MANTREEMTPLSEDDLEAAERAKQERYAELDRLRELNTQKPFIHIGGETRRCIYLYMSCVAGVALYVGVSVLFAWGVTPSRVDSP